jgi:hypothetical protein
MLRRLANFLSDYSPVELHLIDWSTLKRHNWTGPGTNVYKRLLRNDPGITKLDEAAKVHDIAYLKSHDPEDRRQADIQLYKASKDIFNDKTTGFGDKINSWIVKGIMKAQAGLGLAKRRSLDAILRGAGLKHKRRSRKTKNGRIIRTPSRYQQGGFIPALAAILAGLVSGASAVSTAMNKNKQLNELRRHNQVVEDTLAMRGKGVKKRTRRRISIKKTKKSASKN